VIILDLSSSSSTVSSEQLCSATSSAVQQRHQLPWSTYGARRQRTARQPAPSSSTSSSDGRHLAHNIQPEGEKNLKFKLKIQEECRIIPFKNRYEGK